MALFDLTANTNARKVPILNVEYPKDVTMKATDGNATFTAVIAKDGRPDKYTYQWYVNGAAVAGATGATYVRNVSGDKGVHTVWCEVSNKAGTVRTRNAMLTVERLPVLDSAYPADVSVTIGRSATFAVSITDDGYPTNYTYQWYVSGSPVIGANASSYTRNAASVGSEAIYCIVSNEAGSVQSRGATIYVNQEYIVRNGAFVDGGSWGSYCYDKDSIVKQEHSALLIIGDGPGTTRAWSTQYYDFTGKNKLVFQCSQFLYTDANNLGTFYFGATDDTVDGFVAYTAVTAHNYSGTYWVDVDVSHLSGWHLVKCCLIRNGYGQDWVVIQDVYFE